MVADQATSANSDVVPPEQVVDLERTRRSDLGRVMAVTVVAEAAIRLSRLAEDKGMADLQSQASSVVGLVMGELLAQLGISSLLALFILYLRGWWDSDRTMMRTRDGRQSHFSCVPYHRSWYH